LARLGDPQLQEIQQQLVKASKELNLVRKMLPGRLGMRPEAPLARKRELPEHRMLDMRKIRERIQDLISSGAAPEEIESTLKKEFGGNIKIHVESSMDDEPGEEIERELKGKSSKTKVKKSTHTTTRASSSATKSGHAESSKTSGSKKDAREVLKRAKEEMRRLMEELKKKREAKKHKSDG